MLRLAFIAEKDARRPCLEWHYAAKMPMSKPMVCVGAWEDERFIGATIFSKGANLNLTAGFPCLPHEGAELVRVALRAHKAPTSKIVSIAVRLLRKASPGLRLLVSYADPAQGHHGGIYQAMGWTFLGTGDGSDVYWYKGKWTHNRVLTAREAFNKQNPDYHTPEQLTKLKHRRDPGKLRYALGLDAEMAAVLKQRQQPYPKRGAPGGPSGNHPGEGGSTPTAPLHSSPQVAPTPLPR